MEIERAAAVRGKTIRLTWTDGPTKGRTHEHVFHADGTVEWHEPGAKGTGGGERPPYAAMQAGADVCLVSYLAGSGYTLTVALDFPSQRVVGAASGAKDWFPVRGTFQVME
jgi:hypothetical protein